MARSLRIEYFGAYYHVINRGNGGERIFTSKRDHEKFLECLAVLHERFGVNIHSYCLMSNHYHLLIETPQANLSAAIQWLNVSYAIWFNKKHKRHGHLFQGRFKAILVDADEYLTQVSCYIHLNPVKAGITSNPQDYRWSSYCDFIGERTALKWLDKSLLGHFGKRSKTAIKHYRAYVENIDMENLQNPNSLSVGGCILGDSNFVNWVRETFVSDEANTNEIPDIKKLKPAVSSDIIVDIVSIKTGVTLDSIRSKGKKCNQPREIAIYLSRKLSNMPGVELGRYFGGVSGAAITVSCKRFENVLEQNVELKKAVELMERAILNG